jgi:molybdate transport system substrate-binding protein
MSERSSRASSVLAQVSTTLRQSRRRAVVALCVLGVLTSAPGCGKQGGGDGSRRGEPLRVAAAADLAFAFKDVGLEFEKTTGKHVDFTFGSTGLLAKQIKEGAPYDIFAAANVSFVDEVVASGACITGTQQLYAKGRIVLWSAREDALPKSLDELRDPKYAKIAIANPEHAPYGRAARQAMTKTGVWATAEPRAVYGENVQQTMMFAQSGNADVAVIALSLAIVSKGYYLTIDQELHDPLDQALVVCKGGAKGLKANEARSFVEFVGSDAGRAIMKRYGFLLPGESLPPK